MIFKQTLSVFLVVCLFGQAFGDCSDLTLDDCAATAPFETLKDLGNPETCQLFCREIFAGVCKFFLYDQEEDLCSLYDYEAVDYAAACSILGGTPTPKLDECATSTDECLLFTEGYCKYEGKLLENLEIPSGATGCQLACQYYNGDSPCDYFIYNDGDKNCQFLSSTARTCDLIRGPPNPPIENCAAPPTEPPRTTTPETTTASTTTVTTTKTMTTTVTTLKTTTKETTTTTATSTSVTTTKETTTATQTTTTTPVTTTSQKTTTPATTTMAVTTSGSLYDCDYDGQTHSYPGDCHKYYICFENEDGSNNFSVEVFDCGEWVFDPNQGSCIWPEVPNDLCSSHF